MARVGSKYLPPHGRMHTLNRARKPNFVEPAPEPAPEPKRAREEDGQYKADDPATPDVNEAYEGGKPLAPEFSRKMTKSRLLQVAKKKGIKGLSMEMRKGEILAALEKASE